MAENEMTHHLYCIFSLARAKWLKGAFPTKLKGANFRGLPSSPLSGTR